MRSPWPIIITTIVGMAAIAVVVYHFTRETTSVETKYLHRTADEIDATYNNPLAGLIESPDYSDNASPGTGPQMNLGEDPDYDGLSNASENELGTDQRDPDTDDDGTSDGIEVALGTNPLDKTVGGTDFPPIIITPPIVPPTQGYLQINAFYKTVRNLTLQETTWAHLTNAHYGDTVSFLIHVELTNTSTDKTLTATLNDKLESGLKYVNGSGYIQINNGDKQVLADSWITQPYLLTISPLMNGQKPVPIQITFDAQVAQSPTNTWSFANNQVLLQTDSGIKRDTAFVKLIK